MNFDSIIPLRAWRASLVIVALLPLACAEPEPDRAPAVTPTATVDGGIAASQIPFYEAWRSSAHADVTATAFTYWDKDGTVPTTCARCHSSEGFVDFLGADGTAAGTVEKTGPTKSVVRCVTCHAPGAEALTAVTFPSGVKIEGLGREATCMTCHQGRASGADVDKSVAASGVKGDDEASAMLSFTNIHYYPAAATLYAGQVKGGYQYAGQTYDVRFRHVTGYDSCTGCHDPHSARVKIDECATCHTGVKDAETLRDIRMVSSFSRDFDGDGNRSEGIARELDGLRAVLLATIRRYGAERNVPVCYGAAAHPYWFVDRNNDGTCAADEAVSAGAYKTWTPRLLRAAYNYQMASKDPGAFAHNAKYIIQLLHDSIANLNGGLVAKTDLDKLDRTDVGHFNGASQAARRWDADEEVNATCSRCHSGSEGFRFFVQHGVSIDVPETANGLQCQTCHARVGTAWDLLPVKTTTFPGGTVATLPGMDNLCSNCHSGRVGKTDIDAAIAKGGTLSFQNVHYLPAAGTRQGSAAHVGYEYDGQTYAGPLKHTGGVQCTSCHDPKASQHTFLVRDAWVARCQSCHADANGDPAAIRQVHLTDYDGDGNTRESLAAEIDGMADKVLSAMSAAAGADGLCYGPGTYPYFFKDLDRDRKPQCAAAEATAPNRFTAWTPKLLKAAHNLQLSRTDPGAWAHNFDYIGQLLFDSVGDLAGPTATLRRP